MEYESSYGKARKFRDGQRVKLSDEAKRMLASLLGGNSINCDVCGAVKRTTLGDYEFIPDDNRFGGSFGGWRVEEHHIIALGDSAEPSPPIVSPRKPRVGDKVRLTAKGLEYLRAAWVDETSDYRVGLVGRLVDVVDWNGGYDFYVMFEGVKQGGFSASEGWAVGDDAVELVDTPVIERAYPAPRNTTVDEAKLGDDRPATNGEEFELAMLAHFDESDAGRLLSLAATWALFPAQANQAIDLGLFAQRIMRRLDGQAA